MKNLKVGLLAAFAVIGLAGCGECQHVDENHDHKCDKCGQVISECKDEEPKDHLCDWCGAKLSEHAAAANSHNCGICGEKLSDCKDDNHDGKCDVCGKEGIPVHHHDDGTGYCSCGAKITVVSAELDVSGAKLAFALGEEFSDEGVVLTATMLDETTKPISFTTSEPDMSTVGDKIVTVTYDKLDGTTGTKEYTINVSYWSEEDLELFSVVSYLGDAELVFPYMPGMKTQYTLDEDDYIIDWSIVLEDASEEDVIDYSFALTALKKTIKVSAGYDVKYQPIATELPSGAAEYFGVDPDTAFAVLLIPQVELQPGYTVRWEDYDELIVGGLNENGDFVVSNFDIDSHFESFIGLPLEFDYYFNETGLTTGIISSFQDFFNKDIGGSYWFENPLLNGVLPFPNIADTSEDAAVFITNYISLNPFNEVIQSYDLALEFFMQMATSSERTEFTDALVANGFVAGEPVNYGTEDEPYMVTPYTLESKFFGSWEVEVGEELSQGGVEVGYDFSVNFVAPEETYSEMRAYAELVLIPGLGLSVDDVVIEESADGSTITGTNRFETETYTANQVLGGVIADLTDPEGLNYVVETPMIEYPEESGNYVSVLNNGVYQVTASAVKSDGVVTTTIVLSKFVPADLSELKILSDIFKLFYQTLDEPVLDEDYFIDGDYYFFEDSNLGKGYGDYAYYNSIFSTFVAHALPSYLSEYQTFKLYYGDQAGTYVIGDCLYRTGDGLYTVEVYIYPEGKVQSAENALIQISVCKTVPSDANALNFIKNVAYSFSGNPESYTTVAEGHYKFVLSPVYGEYEASELTEVLLKSALSSFVSKYGAYFMESYLVYTSEAYDPVANSYSVTYTAIDGSFALTLSTVISETEPDSGLYYIGIQFETVQAPVK